MSVLAIPPNCRSVAFVLADEDPLVKYLDLVDLCPSLNALPYSE